MLYLLGPPLLFKLRKDLIHVQFHRDDLGDMEKTIYVVRISSQSAAQHTLRKHQFGLDSIAFDQILSCRLLDCE